MWIRRRTNVLSYTGGVVVEANPDRVALWIVNLGAALCHLSPEAADQGGTAGLPIAPQGTLDFRVSAHGITAQDEYYCVDPTPPQNFFVLESIFYPDEPNVK